MKLYARSTINEIRDKHKFRLSKSLGQNFLTDKNIIDKIIEAADISENDMVIEIGPGIGVLTAEAAQRAGHVVALEIDKNLIPILSETLALYNNVEIINADILKTDLNVIIERKKAEDPTIRGVKIIGNLPYYITTPIIMKILEENVKADIVIVMMQKEVAERIKATPGGKIYGAISAAVQYYCEVIDVAKVSRHVFIPEPKVDSAVLRLDIREKKPVSLDDEDLFFACIKASFGQRRKTLLNSLTGICGLNKEETRGLLEAVGIDPIRRAETLSIEEFALIANQLTSILKSKNQG
ncbi:MAG: 16S rRNA (adenine(1518)-N(6)/adenine(1519)-N(6))-dimethyltransferase RsmA [Eubacteriales bacterium]|nr:16S rRNA (adenine(1518)-N(6)/adenine(1519)-N(6))-dimethyltransferase RsmA [Eubacteriales bacterium]MDD4389359.1 16S rRNA (adenine(1518)-N(6)/adenine(1519)-N(6))-dimethyltransferase RsmA [Eubacteriales bacterium]